MRPRNINMICFSTSSHRLQVGQSPRSQLIEFLCSWNLLLGHKLFSYFASNVHSNNFKHLPEWRKTRSIKALVRETMWHKSQYTTMPFFCVWRGGLRNTMALYILDIFSGSKLIVAGVGIQTTICTTALLSTGEIEAI